MIDVSAGDKIPRKGGPGITRSDLLVINKIDLAPFVGASLEVMDRDARKMRGERPFVFANIRAGTGVAEIAAFIETEGGLRSGGTGLATPANSRRPHFTSRIAWPPAGQIGETLAGLARGDADREADLQHVALSGPTIRPGASRHRSSARSAAVR